MKIKDLPKSYFNKIERVYMNREPKSSKGNLLECWGKHDLNVLRDTLREQIDGASFTENGKLIRLYKVRKGVRPLLREINLIKRKLNI